MKKTLKPVKIAERSALTRCSLDRRKEEDHLNQNKLKTTYRIPLNFGFSPGAVFSLVIFKALTCVNARTVAATNQGKPRID